MSLTTHVSSLPGPPPAKETTAEVLVSMLTENTGRHFLDSGGAYGRNWERNHNMELPWKSGEPFETTTRIRRPS